MRCPAGKGGGSCVPLWSSVRDGGKKKEHFGNWGPRPLIWGFHGAPGRHGGTDLSEVQRIAKKEP